MTGVNILTCSSCYLSANRSTLSICSLLQVHSFPPNDTIWRHHTWSWSLHKPMGIYMGRCTFVHDFCIFWLLPMGWKELNHTLLVVYLRRNFKKGNTCSYYVYQQKPHCKVFMFTRCHRCRRYGARVYPVADKQVHE